MVKVGPCGKNTHSCNRLQIQKACNDLHKTVNKYIPNMTEILRDVVLAVIWECGLIHSLQETCQYIENSELLHDIVEHKGTKKKWYDNVVLFILYKKHVHKEFRAITWHYRTEIKPNGMQKKGTTVKNQFHFLSDPKCLNLCDDGM